MSNIINYSPVSFSCGAGACAGACAAAAFDLPNPVAIMQQFNFNLLLHYFVDV